MTGLFAGTWSLEKCYQTLFFSHSLALLAFET